MECDSGSPVSRTFANTAIAIISLLQLIFIQLLLSFAIYFTALRSHFSDVTRNTLPEPPRPSPCPGTNSSPLSPGAYPGDVEIKCRVLDIAVEESGAEFVITDHEFWRSHGRRC